MKKYLIEENKYTNNALANTKKIQKLLFKEIKGRIKLADKTLPYIDKRYSYWSKTTVKGNYSIKLRKHLKTGKIEEIWNGDNEYKNSSEFKNLESKHGKILEYYFNQKWKNCKNEMKLAKTLCNNLMSEYYEILKERINEYENNPPPKNWDGVYVATSK